MKTHAGRPGPTPRISREDVLSVARQLPPERLTMAAISSELGVTAPALYRYFPDRSALLSALVSDARRRLQPPDLSLPWREWMREWAQLDRETWRSHPALHDVAARSSVARAAIPAVRIGMDVLTRHGFTRDEAMTALGLLSYLSSSFARAEPFIEPSELSDDLRIELDFIAEFLDMDVDDAFARMVELALDGLASRLPKSSS
jgi:AcrR family transcriptional regulator